MFRCGITQANQLQYDETRNEFDVDRDDVAVKKKYPLFNANLLELDDFFLYDILVLHNFFCNCRTV